MEQWLSVTIMLEREDSRDNIKTLEKVRRICHGDTHVALHNTQDKIKGILQELFLNSISHTLIESIASADTLAAKVGRRLCTMQH